MRSVSILLPRLVLRDFTDTDRAAFLAYQNDPRYRALYDLPADAARASALFDSFLGRQTEEPRNNLQLGIFDRRADRLLGTVGLRRRDERTAVLGIELAPSEWGRFRLAIDSVAAVADYGFGEWRLDMIIGETASGNRRVEKLARWFGAEIVARRTGAEWMQVRGWEEVDWRLRRDDWLKRFVR